MRNPKDIIINGKTLETILEEHKHWLNKDCEGWESMCADLSNANLSEADLSWANLSRTILSNADLHGADLSNANLSYAYLNNADLRDTNLSYANLIHADLGYANLYGAKLSNADLHAAYLNNANLSYAYLNNADLHDTNLSYAYLIHADLCDTDLDGADLDSADLTYADLSNADLSNADLNGANLNKAYLCKAKGDHIDFRRGKILTESIIGYKKCKGNSRINNFLSILTQNYEDAIVTLEIPAGAVVFSINGNKCRTNKVKVIAINDKNGNDVYRAYSRYQDISYYVGDEFNITNFDLSYNIECSTGIHFFMSRKKQKNMNYKITKKEDT